MKNADDSRVMGPSDRTSQVNPTEVDTSGLSFTGRIAHWSATHRWWVVGGSLLFIVLAFMVLGNVETKTLEYNGEGESAKAFDLIGDRFDVVVTPTEQLVFSNPSLDVNNPAYRSTVEGLVQQLRALPEVESVSSYYDTQDPGMVSDNGTVLLAQVVIEGDADDALDKVDAVVDTVRAASDDAAGFEIAIAGTTSIEKQIEDIDKEDFQTMIVITMVLALVLMLFAFRAVVAAALPLILAMGSIFSALALQPWLAMYTR